MIQRALERRYAKRNDELATLAKMLNATPHFDEGARYQGRVRGRLREVGCDVTQLQSSGSGQSLTYLDAAPDNTHVYTQPLHATRIYTTVREDMETANYGRTTNSHCPSYGTHVKYRHILGNLGANTCKRERIDDGKSQGVIYARLIAELNKEQEAFIASKQAGEKGEAVAPWVGAPNEDALREECLSLSTDRRNFVRAPPPGVEFAWDFEAVQPMAQATLALDPNLEAMRFELVPKVISEENFWRNYFYRVSLLRQGYELNAMASQQQAESNPNQTLASTDSIDHTQVQMTTGQTTTTGVTTASSNSALADSPGHEFVSDTMRVSDTDLEEVREGMKKLGMQPPKEEDWERELEAELKDYEVVTGNNNGDSSGQERSVATATKDIAANDNDWEKQIDELLANEDDEDLK
ncbi:SAP47 protein, partial [Acromyrmex heyeri]